MRALSGCLTPDGRLAAPVVFWLEWSIPIAGQRLPAALSWFRVFYSDSILTRPSKPGDATTPGPSTPQITALAVICSGRDDRIEEI